MREGLRTFLLGLLTLILVGCDGLGGGGSEGRLAHAPRPELLARLQLGQSVLDCREACLGEWKRIQPKAAQFDSTAQWSDLAVLVMRSGYQDDLSLYYLGRAAEGMGFYAPAAGYYRQSIQLSGTSISCANLSRLCGGVTLPNSAVERLAAAERTLAPRKVRRKPPPAASSPSPATAPEPTAEAVEPAEQPQPTPPTPPAPPAAPPAAVGDPRRSSASEYIEPPPASR